MTMSKRNNRFHKPPSFLEGFLQTMLSAYEREGLCGDFEEIYNDYIEEKGNLRARLWYLAQILAYFPRFISNAIYWRVKMIKSYLKIAIRNLKKHKAFSFINVSSLAIGMACAILILLWVQDELGYDRFHENSKYLYRVAIQEELSDGTNRYAITPAPLGPALKETYPEITNTTRVYKLQSVVRYKDAQFREGCLMVDPSFLKMFTFPLIKGDVNTSLNNPHSVIITQEIAEKYFGNREPMGKTVNINNTFDLTITGILKNVPHNSHLKFDILVPFILAEKLGSSLDSWHEYQYYTYVQLDKDKTLNEVNKKIRNIIAKIDLDTNSKPYLQSLTKIHLHSNTKYDIEGQGNIKYIYILSVIALFVLLIACINFMNLSTARSTNRAKEIGVRKVVGAFRTNIMQQFLGESILLALIALIIALFIIQLFIPFFNNLSGKQLSLKDIENISIIVRLLGVAIFTGIISGSYPALLLSSFKPVHILRGTLAKGSRGVAFRKALVVVQFSLSIILIISASIAYRQIDFIRNKNLGFEKDHLLYVPLEDQANIQAYYSFKNELKQNPKILRVSASDRVLTNIDSKTSGNDWEGKNPDEMIYIYRLIVDYDFIEISKMKLLEGRTFSPEFPTDLTKAFVVNQEVVKLMGVESAAGKKLKFWGIDGTIIGVVENFHFKPLHNIIEPIAMLVIPKYLQYAYIRIHPQNISSTIAFIKKSWEKVYPDSLFEYKFLDDDFDVLYRTEQRMSKILNCFSVFAILVACLGLFGLASFSAEKRSKEIGIRKVLGASVINIAIMLSKDLAKWVILANLIAWPIGYFALSRWLQNFAYRTNISIWPFLMAAVLTFFTAFLTVSYQSIKAAIANPRDSLRYE
jgi:putative ABC transport system permease protein